MQTCISILYRSVTLAGYLGMPGAQGGIAFYRTRYAPEDRMYPDIQVQMSCSLVGGVFRKVWNVRNEVSVQSHI